MVFPNHSTLVRASQCSRMVSSDVGSKPVLLLIAETLTQGSGDIKVSHPFMSPLSAPRDPACLTVQNHHLPTMP